jgi:PAS domain S-box-containing protein
MLGYTPDEMIGKHVFFVMDDRGIEISKRNLERRKQGIKEDHEFELMRKDGARVYTIMQTSPIMDDDGNYAGALAGVLDITERKQTEDELRQDLGELEQRVGQRTVELGRVNKWLKDEMEQHQQTEALCRQLLEAAPDATLVANHEGKIVLVNAVAQELFGYSREELLGKDIEILVPSHLREHHFTLRHDFNTNPHVRPMGAGRELSAVRKDGSEFPAEISLGPLNTDDGVLVFAAVRDVSERKKIEEALRENEAQLRAVQKIQELLLPAEPPDVAGVDIAGAMLPAHFAAGDHYDHFPMADGSVRITLGDVSGHGISSALVMASAHAHIRFLAEMGTEIDEILRRTNESLMKQTDEHFITAILGHLDPVSRILTYANAGHPPGYVLDESGAVKATLESSALPLAVVPGGEFGCGEPITLEAGDLVLLLTDGVIESEGETGELFDEERVLDLVRSIREESAADIAQTVCTTAREFGGAESYQDDITCLVIKVENSS